MVSRNTPRCSKSQRGACCCCSISKTSDLLETDNGELELMLCFPTPHGRLHMLELMLGGYLIYHCRIINKWLVWKPGGILTNRIVKLDAFRDVCLQPWFMGDVTSHATTTTFRGEFLQSTTSCNCDLTQPAVILIKHDNGWPLWTPHNELSLNPPPPPPLPVGSHVHTNQYKGQYWNNNNNNYHL